jgi:hypothetical protein
MARSSKLSGSLLARKDAAPSTPPQLPAAPEDVRPASGQSAAAGEGSKPIALTLKVDQARYEALKVLGARTRRSNQEILLTALDAYLRTAGDESFES